jgi:peptidoglycan-associated lipoprotein
MNHLGRVVAIAVASVSVVMVDACHKAPPPAPAAPAPNQDSIARAQAAAAAAAKAAADAAAAKAAADKAAADAAAAKAAADRAAADAAARALADAARDLAAMTTTLKAVVHFDYDKAELRDDSKATLDAKLPILRANPAVTLRIAGNTDDRGSDEYNLALGQRRALAAKQYLVDRGIAASRIETISNGLERKLCQEENESCWSQNRRDEFEITAGGNNLKKP